MSGALRDMVADALRDLRARGRSLAVSTAGLAFALAAALLVGMIALALAAPDPHVADPRRTVMLDARPNPPGEPEAPWAGQAPLAFGPLLKARHAPLDLVSRVAWGGMEFRTTGPLQPALLLAADPDLVDALALPCLAGDLRAALSGHDTIALSVDLVRRLWGELPPAQALGRTLQSHGRAYTVAAVVPDTDPRSPLWGANPMVGRALAMSGFDSPANTLSAEEREGLFSGGGRVFARLRSGTRVEDVAGWMRDAFVTSPGYARVPPAWRAGREAAFFRAVPLDELPFVGPMHALRWRLLGATGAACALLLALAALNAASLQAAHLQRRQRETALRRSLGASDAQLLALWSLEAAGPLVACAAAALLLAWWAVPPVAAWMGLPPDLPIADPPPRQALAGLLVAVVSLEALLVLPPALVALRRVPAAALQGRTGSEGPWGRRARQALLGLQWGGALLLLSVAGVLAGQQHHLLHVDRGIDTRDRLVLEMETDPEHIPSLAAFTDALSRSPAVRHWAFSAEVPAAGTQGGRERLSRGEGRTADARVSLVSPGVFDTYGMTLLAGDPRRPGGDDRVVIDATTARRLGFASPVEAVGASLQGGGDGPLAGAVERRVVAVMKDVRLDGARDEPVPHAFLLTDRPLWNVSVTGPDPRALRAALEAAWKAHGLPVPFVIERAEDQLADAYRQEAQLTTTVAVVAALSVGVAMIGAWTMVADTLRRRRAELVLHRLHGAGDGAIARRVTAELGAPLLVAAIVALPLAAWIGWLYLDGFHERIEPAASLALVLAASLGATLAVTALAALRHVRLALALQPIEALDR